MDLVTCIISKHGWNVHPESIKHRLLGADDVPSFMSCTLQPFETHNTRLSDFMAVNLAITCADVWYDPS